MSHRCEVVTLDVGGNVSIPSRKLSPVGMLKPLPGSQAGCFRGFNDLPCFLELGSDRPQCGALEALGYQARPWLIRASSLSFVSMGLLLDLEMMKLMFRHMLIAKQARTLQCQQNHRLPC